MKKHNSGAGVGAMLTKTETSSGAEFISFLQELRSPAFTSFLWLLQLQFVLRLRMCVLLCPVLNVSYSACVSHPAFGMSMNGM